MHELKSTTPVQGAETTETHITQALSQRLQHLNLTITTLQQNLANLNPRQGALKKQIANYRAAISPIRKLPSEILQIIFIQCLLTTRNAAMSIREAPLLLCRICRHWTQIAYMTPRLWSSIHIVIPMSGSLGDQRHRPPSLEDISVWLRRSGALPLSVSICLPDMSPLFSPSLAVQHTIRPLLDTVSEFKSRWRSLHLSIRSCDWETTLGQFSASDLPLLESVYISGPLLTFINPSGYLASQDPRVLWEENAILRAPSLRSIGLPFYGSEVPQLPIRWGNLTNLTLLGDAHILDVPEMERTLLLCPSLITCTLDLLRAIWPPIQGSNLTRIDLLNLESLSFIDDSAFGPASDLLKCLHTPQLRHFSYEQKCNLEVRPPTPRPQSDFLDSLSTFLGRLAVPLEELDLIVEQKRDVDVVGVLQLMHGLKRLSLRHSVWPNDIRSYVPPRDASAAFYYFGDDHLASLTPPKRQGGGGNDEYSGHSDSGSTTQGLGDASPICACPNLEVFHCIGSCFSDAILLDFLRSRCGGTEGNGGLAPLKKVSITVVLHKDGSESEDTRSQIRNLQAADQMMFLDVTFVAWTGPPPSDHQLKRSSSYDGLELWNGGWRL